MPEATSGHELRPRDLPPLHIRIAAAILAVVLGVPYVVVFGGFLFTGKTPFTWPWW